MGDKHKIKVGDLVRPTHSDYEDTTGVVVKVNERTEPPMLSIALFGGSFEFVTYLTSDDIEVLSYVKNKK